MEAENSVELEMNETLMENWFQLICTLFYKVLQYNLIHLEISLSNKNSDLIWYVIYFQCKTKIDTKIFKIIQLYQVDLKLSFLLPIKSFCRQRFYLIVSNLSSQYIFMDISHCKMHVYPLGKFIFSIHIEKEIHIY